MMNEREANVDDLMWSAISPTTRKERAVRKAAEDPIVHGVLGLFIKYGYNDPATKETIKDVLEERIVAVYDLSPDHGEQVFRETESLIKEEMGADGEA